MRRPVRPFVTEYRGGSRRPSNQGLGPNEDPFKSDFKGESGQADQAGTEPNRNGAAWTSPAAPAHPEPQEDGYEAALRAADALFAGNRSAPQEARPTPEGEAPKPGSPTGGRVLRVLDEAPSPEMLRLEAEFAPKKRGRKPGSKNKPKVAALVAQPAASPAPDADASEAPALPVATSLAGVLTDAALSAALDPAAGLASGPRGERYAWVRTRLKPGQQWKRRLPKVAW